MGFLPLFTSPSFCSKPYDFLLWTSFKVIKANIKPKLTYSLLIHVSSLIEQFFGRCRKQSLKKLSVLDDITKHSCVLTCPIPNTCLTVSACHDPVNSLWIKSCFLGLSKIFNSEILVFRLRMPFLVDFNSDRYGKQNNVFTDVIPNLYFFTFSVEYKESI